MHKLSLMVLGVLAIAGCDRSTDSGANAVFTLNEPVDAPLGQAPDASRPPDAVTLGQAIAATFDGGLGDDAKIISATADLNGDGTDEALAYLISSTFCGSGGCNLFVLAKVDGKWAVTDNLSVSQLPIYLLPTVTNGWSDLGVTIAGGGVRAGLMKIPHGVDGYADNPTVAPATPTTAEGARLLIADDYDMAVPVKKDAKAQ